jgi:TrmH family RNA methyltransferase
MITKNEIKRIKSLRNKKDRKDLKLFIAEGEKTVLDLLNSGWEIESLYSINQISNQESVLISSKDMDRMTLLKSPSTVLGVFRIPENKISSEKGRVVVLDGVTDPGNLGTIIRLCSWFGISTLVCSENTVDCYNPKVVQATMGSLSQVNCIYTNLVSYLENTNKPIYATLLEGESIYNKEIDADGIIVMGSESHGISDEVIACAQHRLTIPQFGVKEGTESLNVAIAASIVLGQAFRP